MVFGSREIIASSVALFIIVSVVASLGAAKSSSRSTILKSEMDQNVKVIFNFNSESEFSSEDAGRWYESSDTVRTAGMSKAVFSLQKSKLFQRAIMFALINPQPNGAGFAGVKNNITFEDNEGKEGILLQVRGQGGLKYWKVVLTDSEFLGLTKLYTYEAKFPVNLESEDFEIVRLPMSEFKAFYRGQEIPDAPPMDLKKIGAFGLQTFGGVYDQFKQTGAGSLEIDYVAFY